MLKKKRFSGLFGVGMTEIPSPGPEQTNNINGNNTNGFNSPQLLSNQGRQSSMSMLTTTTDGYFNSNTNPTNNTNGAGAGSVGDEDPAGNVLTRGEVHASLENLKKLVIAAESYRELTTKLAKTTKQLGKCFKEYGETKGMDSTYVMCLKSSANFYESYSEMETKLATCLQKDFEQLQGNWEKHTKRVTKDERAHDEILGDLDERIKKISMNYDKKNKRPDPNTALMSHEKYISTLSELQESIASAKKDHRNTVARRERYTHSLTAQIACRLSEAQFLAIERQLRGSGPSLLKIKEWAPYAGQDMPPPTLVTNGDPTIEIRGGSFEEYIARHTPSGGGGANGGANGGGNSAGNGLNGNMPYVPGAYQSQRMDPGMASPNGSPAPITLTEMPQITLPPFAPMQQHLQQQQQQGSSAAPANQQPYFQSPTPTGLPTTMPIPNVVTPAAPSTRLPTNMPEPKNYITPQQQQRLSIIDPTPPPQMVTPQPTRVDKVLTTTTTTGGRPVFVQPSGTDHKVLVKEVTIAQPATKTILVGKPAVVSTDSTVIVADPVPVLTTSPPTTPGAFPTNNIASGITAVLANKEQEPVIHRPAVVETLGTVTQTADGGIAVNTNLDGSWPEDHGSVSTKVGGSSSATDDGRSTTRSGGSGGGRPGDQAAMMTAKQDYFRETRALTAADEAADAAALDRYHRENYSGRYRYADEESVGGDVGTGARFRGPDGGGPDDRDRDRDRDRHLDDVGPDDLYDDPYSPMSGDQHDSYYDDGGDDIARVEPRRFYDDDESQHSGSIPIQRDREYYTTRYEEQQHREYDRSYQHYSSSMPAARRQSAYPDDRDRDRDRDRERERDLDRGDWATAASALAAADEVSSLSGYAREQYPASREYPAARPTLEDRERELDIINQKVAAAAAAANANGGGRTSRAAPGADPNGNGYGPRRPASSAPGTVAQMRRRFSDLSVSDMAAASAASGGMTSPGPRPRGMSGSGQSTLIQDSIRSRGERDRDSRYPPRASTPQSRAAVTAAGYQYERKGQGLMTGGSSSQLVGGTNGRYSRTGGGGGGGHLSDYEDGSSRMSRLVGDQRERRR
ncbi:hypothetical protein EC957_004078 [Mortierella hygrophila]|uniref:Uncharacterized protein n=1 Tax=Mortierella hygrophila TaxID=979708 RepID=A0A9P6K8T8_9FUNG|nr:hypothetical protein EC957_004078 [Mortierella hygrophila]